jgi:S1-C subfamily serine protease
VFDRVSPSVVKIETIDPTASGSEAEGTGSGVVVNASGLVLTNYHVVSGSIYIAVHFANGELREAQIQDAQPENDLALLKLDLPPGIPIAALGDSDQVHVGDTAIAIGSPFGLDQTVTQGIISAIHREFNNQGKGPHSLIQTDAPINPGNSGGPLLNANGEVIGINTMIHSPIAGSVGIGFAVPINTAKSILP